MAVIAIGFILVWRFSASPRIVHYYNFNRHGGPVLLIGTQAGDRFGYMTYPLEMLSQCSSMRHNSLIIKPKLLRTEGDTQVFSFEIVDQYVVREFPEVRYSGEETLTVARGADWYIQFIWM